MKIELTELPGLLIIEPKVIGDTRGFFYESFNQAAFNKETGLDVSFVQDNHSRSTKGVLRGLHYQLPPYAQGKLVRVVQGAVWDVAVDMRKSSPTFGRWVGIELTESNHRQFWMPPGFAHGFLVLSETADFLYKTTNYYAPSHDRGVIWNDIDLNINWPKEITPQLSAKDLKNLAFASCEVFD
jgi:dTDP-4-dehydrorhamnose 3,5-epimerase